jgi:hypothetical protein
VPQHRGRKRVGVSTSDAPAAVALDAVWTLNFQFDAEEQGRPIEICSIEAEPTRECSGGVLDRSIAQGVCSHQLDEHMAGGNFPVVLRCNNGPRFHFLRQ